MIEHLKKLYQNQMIIDPSTTGTPEQYFWYQTDEGPVGIQKTALSKKERTLLELFLTPYVSNLDLTQEEDFWYGLLFREELPSSSSNERKAPFRFIHFYVKDPSIDVSSFSEASRGLFPSNTVILWETKQEGVLIASEELLEDDQAIEYEDLVNAITSDFYTDLLLYVGERQAAPDTAGRRYHHEKSYFHACRRHFPTESVFHHDEQIPFLLLYQSSKSARHELFDGLLQETDNDKELLHSIREYLASNMNVTTAAKKLFIHRNSLQYRVDKFIEKTGLDVKDFPRAVTVYLALLEKQL